ncbi:MAG: hypothetical protein GC201_13675 [Alphaproteobacteria bacterium]|nr:hypothetical protein [Alphaproteobacteria bacterium]
MKYAPAFLLLGLIAAPLLAPRPALADGSTVKFCEPACDSKGCKPTRQCLEATIENRSWSVVEKVKIDQRTDNQCKSDSQVHTANLRKGHGFTGYFNAGCTYKVTYVTTKGCGGDKDGLVKPEDLEKYVVENDALAKPMSVLVVQLENDCGSLKVKKVFRTNRLTGK